jgi:hypothetical protein
LHGKQELQMDRLTAFKTGMGIDKAAFRVRPVAAAATVFSNPIVASVLFGLPVAGGAAAGALASKVTSPTADLTVAQKELVLAEMEEALVELRRRQAFHKAHGDDSVAPRSRNERPLHI